MSNEPVNVQLHREVWECLPWLVNGTASEEQEARALAHIAQCDSCRDEYQHQQRLFEALQAPDAAASSRPDVEAGWSRLLEQLPDHTPARGAANDGPPADPASPPQAGGRRTGWLAAVAVAQAAALAAMAVSHLLPPRDTPPSPYQTLSTPSSAPATGAPRWRVLPADDMSLKEWRALLDSQHLQVLGGPNSVGAWELAARDAGADERMLLERLRQEPRLRLVEPLSSP